MLRSTILSLDILVKALIGAPRRSGPNEGNASDLNPPVIAAAPRIREAVKAPCPPLPYHVISFIIYPLVQYVLPHQSSQRHVVGTDPEYDFVISVPPVYLPRLVSARTVRSPIVCTSCTSMIKSRIHMIITSFLYL